MTLQPQRLPEIRIVFATLTLCLLPALALSSPKPSGKLVSMSEIDLPHYSPPAAYREDLVVSGKQGDMTMKRFVDHGKIRTEMSTDGNDFVMLETGDPSGTMYMIMPEQKTAMKQSRDAMNKAGAKLPKKEEPGASAPPADIKVEDLGEDKLDGVAVKKLRMVAEGGDVLGWFDKTTGAPVRMESVFQGEKSTIEWKNRKPGPQSEELFQVPKGYAVTDMDEMMKKMGGMGGMGGMGVGGMAKGMAGGMVQGMGSNLGGSLGGMIGGSLGGPLGSIAGQFIGGKIGGMLGKKAANAIN